MPLLFVPLWDRLPSDQLLRWKPLPGLPAPQAWLGLKGQATSGKARIVLWCVAVLMLRTATLFHFHFVRAEWAASAANVPWDEAT